MIKNGRPYTCEEMLSKDDIDSALVTTHPYSELKTIAGWIKDNIRHSDTEYDKSSYSLKHLLERETGIYLTNNAFKDAMLLAGFKPVNPNEKNWHFKMYLLREDRSVKNPFVEWMETTFLDKREQDFANDAIADKDFPLFADHDVIMSYLLEQTSLSDVFEIFEGLWEGYKKNKAF